MEAVGEAFFECVGSALQFGQPFGEPIGAGAQLFESVLQAGGAAGQPFGAVFEARTPRFEVLERAVQLDRDVAGRPDLVALGGEHLGEKPLLLGHAPQRRVLAGRRFEFAGDSPGTPQGLAIEAGKKRLEFEFQGKAGAGRGSLTGGEPLGAGGEAFDGFARLAAAGGGLFERVGEGAGSGAGPFRSRAEQSAAARSAREALPQARDRRRGAPEVRSERGKLRGAVGAPRREPLAQPAEWLDGLLDRRRADHGAHAGALDDAALRALQQGEPPRGRDRTLAGRNDDLEGGLPARADRAVERFRALPRAARARQLLDSGSAR